ncbi:MAG TPA: PIN domain-containing protein [Candidatus Limnocylindria bacterium]|nr:PIN domain-containing protein [Candidatus Limnocylindria bacterium]
MLDATFLIDHLRGDAGAVARWEGIFREGDQPFVNEVAVCEVRTGLRPADEELLVRLLEPVEFVQPGPAAALTAGRWRWDASHKGKTLSLADALIAAAADALECAILTRNLRDFSLTPVPVETY